MVGAFVFSPETLGAHRPGGSYVSVPGAEVFYWRPCLTRDLEGETHCWFIASNYILNWYCPACRPPRIRVVEPAPMAQKPEKPWGDGVPIWGDAPTSASRAMIEWYEERAAILEADGNLDRVRAEEEAYRQLTQKITTERVAAQQRGQMQLF